MDKTIKIYVSEHIKLPLKQINKEKLKEIIAAYTYKLPNMDQETRAVEPDIKVKMWRIEGNSIYLPAGDIDYLHEILDCTLEIHDSRSINPMKKPFKFKGSLFKGGFHNGDPVANQVKIVREVLAANRGGLIISPPRTGKTVIAAYLVAQLGLKTLVLTTQEELLNQFYDTFMALTTVDKRRIAVVKDLKEVANLDVALVTYQKFIRERGQQHLEDLKDYFGLVIVDEVHSANAEAFSKIVGKFNAQYRWGLTATDKRKDKREVIVRRIIGDTIVEGDIVSLKPTIKIFETGIGKGRSYKMWNAAMKFLAEHEIRNKIIVAQALQDLKSHPCVIIPVDTKKQQAILHKMFVDVFRAAGEYNQTNILAYNAKSDKRRSMALIESGKIKIVITIRSMMKQGINLKVPSVLYVIIPTNNPLLFKQMSYRIATPRPDKKLALVRVFIDDINLSINIFKGLWWNEISKGLNKSYLVEEKTMERIKQIVGKDAYVPKQSHNVKL
jgi:superfamily II DNA or RNA helicase